MWRGWAGIGGWTVDIVEVSSPATAINITSGFETTQIPMSGTNPELRKFY